MPMLRTRPSNLAVSSLLSLAAFVSLPVIGGPRAALAETTVFVVRHAEKVDASEDPDLDITGRERARLLRDMLRAIPIESVYASKYKRTQQTVAPAAEAQKRTVVVHTTDEIAKLAGAIRAASADSVDRAVLIAGHSNTTVQWLKALGISSIEELLDHEWDNLFVVTIGNEGRARLLHLHYGY
ncbi:MAG: phosphoglycerate mutase family protein [Candidatus Eisenbacteria bacterium]|nr:phosphoglycerate mutase family protein [Candidatus Eisenbacteria bacterium]